MGNEAIKPSVEADFDGSNQTQIGDPSSLTPTSASASDDGNESHQSFISQTSSNNASAFESNLNHELTTSQPMSHRPVLSISTSSTSNRKAPAGFNPLASIGSASLRSLSPPSAREYQSSRLFPATEDIDDDGTGSPKSPFFPDGLSGGLISAMSDINIQRQMLGQDVRGYITCHYALRSAIVIPKPGTKKWDEYIASIQGAVDPIPMALSGNPADTSQTPSITVGHKVPSGMTGDSLLPVDKLDGGSSSKSIPTAHNPRAAPFIPRRTTTIENLEQVAEEHDGRRGLTITKPRPSWGQVPNWRSRGKGRGGACRQPPISRHDNKPPSVPSLPVGPRASSSTPRQVLPPSVQVVATTQSSSSALDAIGKRDTTRRTFESFRPMNAVVNPDAYKQQLSEEDIAFRVENGMSLNYHGNHENSRNISAKIPENQNCAVWITNLPSHCTTRALLRALMHHRPGRIWATHINAAEEPRHRHAAAKIIFYHPAEAKRLLKLALKPGIYVQNHRISAIYNKQRVAAQEYDYPTSRALEIRGDKAIVSEQFLRSLFEQHFKFEDEAVDVLAEFKDVRVIEWRFGSMRAQAASAYQLLERMYPCVDIRYATDPCAQYMSMPGQKQFDQLVAPVQDSTGTTAPSSSGAPGGPDTKPSN
ncbi:hypothetical protein N0V93_008423 [Gnomoniopsis smithogilvyi]|uniref:RRM domain-containing protein n=1 Tax=Gnomoniopsis smithogilvyi TaxID=1191159 RepID=A0A9W8YQ09_9PEZI|nr:hypothetical protein N0V93_008423 [Gnomoniopsis smithogilvyi]